MPDSQSKNSNQESPRTITKDETSLHQSPHTTNLENYFQFERTQADGYKVYLPPNELQLPPGTRIIAAPDPPGPRTIELPMGGKGIHLWTTNPGQGEPGEGTLHSIWVEPHTLRARTNPEEGTRGRRKLEEQALIEPREDPISRYDSHSGRYVTSHEFIRFYHIGEGAYFPIHNANHLPVAAAGLT